jgi:cysteinyl-tRNA synthetase
VSREEIPQEITDLAQKRLEARNQKNFTESDTLRKQIEEKGYVIEDVGSSFKIKQKS